MSSEQNTLAGRYAVLAEERLQFLNRARECAKLTIPTLIPPEGATKTTIFETPYQGVGARGLNNLASKLLLSLFPPNAPFFSMPIDDFDAEELGGPDGRAKVEEGLGKYERSVMKSIENSGDRSRHFEALKHLIVGGNVLLHLPQNGKMRVHTLSQYVVVRSPEGEMLETIIEEVMFYANLPENLKELIKESQAQDPATTVDTKAEIKLYTCFKLVDNRIESYQEIAGIKVPGSEGSWPKDKSPVIPLRWTSIDGQDYGRGYIEEYLGDLISLEGLSRSLLEGSVAAARVIFLVKPGSQTRAKDITEAENGSAVPGLETDVSALQLNKQADMQVAQAQAEVITERLSYAFLLNSAIQRSGERVTAEEVRFMAGELEDALGGVYSIMSQEYQMPYIKRVIDILTRKKLLPSLPEGVTSPVIVTGLEALGRGHDLTKYRMFLEALAPLGPEVVAQELNLPDYIKRVGTALGIDQNGLVKSIEDKQAAEEQRQALKQQETAQDALKAAAPALVKEGAAVLQQP